MSADYDRLSDLGIEQARLLAEWIDPTTSNSKPLDEIVCGPAERHRHTARLVHDRLAEDPSCTTKIRFDPRLDEHDLSSLIRHAASDPAPAPSLAAMLRDFGTADELVAKSKALHRLTESLVTQWVEGTRAGDGIESWRDFSARVRAAFEDLAARRGASLLVVTSVGPLAVMLETCLGLSPMRAFQTAWRARNSSVTDFIAGPPGVTLNAFNLVSHLPDSGMHTHR
jgi:broad specificity phosphatase PhoE